MTAEPATQEPAEFETGGEPARRTDPRSFAVRGVAMLGQLGLPLVIASFTIFKDGKLSALAFFVPIAIAVVAFNFALAYAQWLRFTYAVGGADIRVESGLLSRSARSVPYERIQDVSLEQKLIARLFGLVEVKFETGAGGKDELVLRYLTEAEGERLRETVRSQKAGDGGAIATNPGAYPAAARDDLPPLFAMGPRRVITFGLFEFSLAVVAVVGGALQQVGSVMGFDLWDLEHWQERLAGPGGWFAGLADLGPVAQVVGITLAVAALLVLGFSTGLVRTALREWDFRLERTDKGLRRRRGLLTRTDVVMPLCRVQALRIGTGVLRRFFGWHSLRVVSLAQDSGSANHDAAPFARMDEIAPIVTVTGFHLPAPDADWQRGSGRYRFDRAALSALVLVPLAAVLAFLQFGPLVGELPLEGWLWIVPLLGLAAIAAKEAYDWRFAANALDAAQLFVRRNLVSPKLSVASRIKLQSVEIACGPIAQRRGYATLHLGLAGGTMRLRGIPVERAKMLRAAILASIGRHDFSELN